MKRRIGCLLLAICMLAGLAAGCSRKPENVTVPTETETVATEPEATIPADGNPADVTCQGSYTRENPDGSKVVATIGDEKLTNAQLAAYYWMEVAAFQSQEARDAAPDLEKPLDTQPCPLEDGVNSWQQFFLRRALNTWHGVQALTLQSEEKGIPTEEAYQPNEENHEKYMTGIPATKFLYGYNHNYTINTLHQAYLDNLPELLRTLAGTGGYADTDAMARALTGVSGEQLLDYAALYNKGYMYATALSYLIEPTEEEVEEWYSAHEQEYTQAGITKNGEKLVDLRQVLVLPESADAYKDRRTGEDVPAVTVTIRDDGKVETSQTGWDAAQARAEQLEKDYEQSVLKNRNSNARSTRDALFADFAHLNSQDLDTAPDGGKLSRIQKGELIQPLDEWAFDSARESGDVGIVRSDYGWHLLFYTGSVETWYAEAEENLIADRLAQALTEVKENYSVKIDYAAIELPEAAAKSDVLTPSKILYPDVAHQRYPEIPLYLQQDYPDTMYGNYKVSSHGCGITTMSMLASYMADEPLTVPVMCARYGNYCYQNGTDGKLFVVAPAEMGFYLRKQTYNWKEAKQALEDGYVVTCVQTKGYWTRGGHYLALEKLVDGQPGETEKRVQVRDSNIFNYGRLEDHKLDAFKWETIPPNAQSFWIYENKNVTFAACSRCGDASAATRGILGEDYVCPRCRAAVLRRSVFLNTIAE